MEYWFTRLFDTIKTMLDKIALIAKKYLPILLFLIGYLLFLLTIYKNSAVSTMDITIFNLTSLTSNSYSAYIELLSLLNPNRTIVVYHFLVGFSLTILFITAYFVTIRKYQSALLALVPLLFIVVSPKYIGLIIYNANDTLFSILYFIALCLIWYFNHTEHKFFKDIFVKSLILGIIFGIAFCLNIIGLTLYLIYLINVMHTVLIRNSDSKFNHKVQLFFRGLKEFLLIFLFSLLVSLMTWSFLGTNFFNNIIDVIFRTYTQNPSPDVIYLFGNSIQVGELSFSQIYLYFFFTTPIILLVLFFVSLLFLAKKLKDDLYILIFAGIFLNAFSIFILTKLNIVTIQDIYYLYPLFSYFSGLFFIELYLEIKNYIIKYLILFIVILQLAYTSLTIFKLYPYTYIYFNELTNNTYGASELFALDYLQLNLKEATDWIINDMKNNSKTQASVYTCDDSALLVYYSKNKFTPVSDMKAAEYIICSTPQSGIVPNYLIARDNVVLNTIIKVEK